VGDAVALKTANRVRQHQSCVAADELLPYQVSITRGMCKVTPAHMAGVDCCSFLCLLALRSSLSKPSALLLLRQSRNSLHGLQHTAVSVNFIGRGAAGKIADDCCPGRGIPELFLAHSDHGASRIQILLHGSSSPAIHCN